MRPRIRLPPDGRLGSGSPLCSKHTQADGGWVTLLLSFNGVYVEPMSFLAPHGLFAAHVTGNFVTLGASLVLGTSGAIAKLLALPMFCIVVVAARLLGNELRRLRPLLSIKF